MELRTSTTFHIAGYSYAFFWWGLFTLYCLGHQFNRWRIYLHRRQQLKLQQKSGSQSASKATFDPILPWERWLRPLDRVVAIPYVTEMIAIKHIIGVFLFICINLIWIFFAPFKWNDAFTTYKLESIGLFDRRAAFIGMVNWCFVFMLASRNSLLSSMSGFTFEQMIPYHRWLARIGLLEFIPHFVWRMMHGYEKTYIVADTLFYDLEQTSGTICMLGFLLLFVTSFGYIRRHFFEFFYYAHIIGIIVAIIFACIHEVMCFVYFMPVVILWVADRAWRSYQSWYIPVTPIQINPAVSKTEKQEGIVRVLFDHSRLASHYHPGQYVFVAMAKKGKAWCKWQFANWHPMTISEVFRGSRGVSSYINSSNSSVINETIIADEKKNPTTNIENAKQNSDKTVDISDTASIDTAQLRRRGATAPAASSSSNMVASLHIKALGGFTRDLLDHADQNQALHFKVDGPYGPRLEYQDYNVLSCFAAGIGITPALTLIKDCVERRSAGIASVMTHHVQLVWVVRSSDEVKAFAEQIDYWRERASVAISPLTLDLSVYVTREPLGEENLAGFDKTVYGKRPKIDECMNNIPEQKSVFVHTCGSDQFMTTVVNQAVERKWDYHHETFEF
ncbi:ferric reductase like transmembrane component-domain-containing protein [Halteromyces radiatus]|uniref:ferric reductase like transmembrane component-domain-containing protein n=1 Tax=Halteromyces radiatus TaxID=101107 RepID=UPI0022204FF5|nr:ferric reductase like transmembrane component-domain-containing protein [Halteromyces radiatus]KAI8086611.1 ferric reductase like transmembrane component-domain-containing protein [Halteromyces radiatus]